MFKSDATLDFHNKLIGEVALGQRCPNSDRSSAYILTSPLGHVYTNACPDGLHCVKLYGDTSYDDIKWNTKVDFIRASSLMPSNPHAKKLKTWLQAYFRNPLQTDGIELSFCGLEEYGVFNSKIWMTIRDTCPPGDLMSYSELGVRSGYGPGSSKVVGYAINKNPYMLVVGDHRVVKATGEIWCEDNSQRNKLRRLLVNYEISFTPDSLEDALLKVKERNKSSKATRTRTTKESKSVSRTRVKSETGRAKGRGIVKKEPAASRRTSRRSTASRRRVADDETEDEGDDDEMEDDDDDDE